MVAKSKNGNFICVILNFFYILFEYIFTMDGVAEQ